MNKIAASLGVSALLVASTLSSSAAHTGAVYRDGLPEVLVPSRPRLTRTVENQFHETYSRAGRPRVVIYWNRALDDELTDRKTQQVDMRAAGIETGPVAAGVIRIDTTESIINRPVGGSVPSRLAAVETAFVQMMAQQGVRLVDRAAILRIEHARARKGKTDASKSVPDTRTNEIDALSAHADLLLEIMILEAGNGPDEVEFKVIAKSTRSGVVPFSLTTRALASAAAQTGFFAGDSGFVRKVPPPRSMHEVGRQLATDTMATWSAALSGK